MTFTLLSVRYVMENSEISKIKLELDEAKEYLENNLCRQCAEMAMKIEILEKKLSQIQDNS